MSVQKNTLKEYIEIIKHLHSDGVIFCRIKDFLNHSDRKVCYLRHDVDEDIECAYDMATAEHDLGIHSTYYILTTDTAKTWFEEPERKEKGLQMIQEMQGMGHEIGLHYDIFGDWFWGSVKNPDDHIKEALGFFRDNGVNIDTCSAHGSSRMLKVLAYREKIPYETRVLLKNQLIWSDAPESPSKIIIRDKTLYSHSLKKKDYGLKLEAYHLQSFLGGKYISDVRSPIDKGRVDLACASGMDMERFVRELGTPQQQNAKKGRNLIRTSDISSASQISGVFKNVPEGEAVQMSIHPHHWRKKNNMKHKRRVDSFGVRFSATFYDRFYINKGFKYDRQKMTAMLKKHTNLFDESYRNYTLLDVGCGDGFWSHILAEHYIVRAEDPSMGGIMVGSCNDEENKVEWVCGKSDTMFTKHDVTFSRCPSFFNRSRDETFQTAFDRIWERTNKVMVMIIASSAPFDRWTGTSYMHSPTKLEKFCSQYGKTNLRHESGYIWVEIQKEGQDI